MDSTLFSQHEVRRNECEIRSKNLNGTNDSGATTKKPFEAANPIRDGAVKFDTSATNAREDAIVRLLLKQPESVIVLGGGHDLADNLPSSVEYVRITTKQYGRAAK